MEYKASSSDVQKLSRDEDDTSSGRFTSSVKSSCGKGDCAKVFDRILVGFRLEEDFRARDRDGDCLTPVAMDSISAIKSIGTVLNVDVFKSFARLVMTSERLVLNCERRRALEVRWTDVDMKEVSLQQCRHCSVFPLEVIILLGSVVKASIAKAI